ncbi:lysophospholipid acyltransferase 7-like [Ornithodoros turicata]|uniref:lysophospholipid acyltransferase 7-like n=1 Tax=Ornithodoros turicata TaxID=34597 RepID=UPI00313A0639
MNLSTDIIYTGLLLLCVMMGHFLYIIQSAGMRRNFCTVFGIILVVIVSGWHTVHPLTMTVVNSLIVIYVPVRFRTKLSFVFSFGYLIFFKYLKMYNIQTPPDITNCIQMMLTLKMAGVSIELDILREKRSNQKDEKSKVWDYEENDMNLTPLDIFHYAFCYVGVLVGPYYRYRTYRDFIRAPYATSVNRMAHCLDRIKVVPLYIVIWFLVNMYTPADYIGQDSFYRDHGLIYRLLYLWPVFLSFRMRLYTGFILGECGCIAAGMGLYPSAANAAPGAGPTNLPALVAVCDKKNFSREEFDYRTVYNVDESGCEISVTVRDGIRHWNNTVQYWLAVYFYKRLPFNRAFRGVLTMVLSSIWHGLQPGYFVCLVSASAFLVADRHLELWTQRFRGVRYVVSRLLLWLLKTEAFTYMLAAFLLLDGVRVWRYYSHVYFVGHLYVLLVILWGQFLRDRSYDPQKK